MGRKHTPEPALISYFFVGIFVDWGRTVSRIYTNCVERNQNNTEKIQDLFESSGDNDYDLSSEYISLFPFIGQQFKNHFLIWFYILQILIQSVMTIILFFPPVIIHLLIAIGLLIIYIPLFLVICPIAFLTQKILRTSTQCQKCHTNNKIPDYECLCGVIHHRIVPNKYGILSHQCKCLARIKSTNIGGRFNQPGKWRCKKCGCELNAGAQMSVTIPVVGGKNSGKTSFIISSLLKIQQTSNINYKLKFEYAKHVGNINYFSKYSKLMQAGDRLPQTNSNNMIYYQFNLTPRKRRFKNFVSVCDIPGNIYEESSLLINQLGLTNSKSIILLIDPLSIPNFRQSVSEISNYPFEVGTYTPEATIYSLINAFQNMNFESNSLTKKFELDIAIIFTKVDFEPIMRRLGPAALAAFKVKNALKSNFKALNQFCIDFLKEYGEDNFYNALKTNFKNYQFFICSSLGSSTTYDLDKVINVDNAIYWAISKACPKIRIEKMIDSKMVVSESFDFDESGQ